MYTIDTIPLGSLIEVFVDDDEEIPSIVPTKRTMRAYLLGYATSSYDRTSLLGWDTHMARLKLAGERRPGEFLPRHRYCDDVIEECLLWYLSVDDRTPVQLVSRRLGGFPKLYADPHKTVVTKPSVVVSGKPEASGQALDLTDWRMWRSSIPGECPCGSVRGVCPYHP